MAMMELLSEDGISKNYRKPYEYHQLVYGEPRWVRAIQIKDGFKLRRGLITYRVGSVVGFDLEHGDCPFEGVAKAKARGHKLYWLNQEAASITAHRREPEVSYAIEVGDIVRMHGKYFTVEFESPWEAKKRDPHLKLVEIEDISDLIVTDIAEDLKKYA